jgi:hypothetical protein
MTTTQQITAAAELDRLLLAAKTAGVQREQIGRFIRAGYIPQPKQLEFHAACRLADAPGGPVLIGYGGARGPGKSHASVEQAAVDDCQRIPGLKVLFLRKIGKAAKESFNDLRQKTLHHVAHDWSAHSGVLSFPNGSLIVIGNFYNEADIDKYLGIEYDLIVIEEATQLSEDKFNKLGGSLRTSKPNWRPRMYLTTNPGGIGHQWFKRRFVLPWRAGRETETRFIAGNYKDNKFLNREYIDYLLSLTGVLGRMWRDGDWDIGAGQFFVHWDYERHVIRPLSVPDHWPVWASLDYGFSHPTAVYIHTRNDSTVYTIAEHVQARWLVPQHAKAIHETLYRFGRRTVDDLEAFVAGHDVFAERGNSDGKTIADQYQDAGIKLTPANIGRISGAAEMLRRMGDPEAGIAPTWQIFDTCPRLIECLPGLQTDPNRPEDVLKVDANEEGLGGDDEYDGARYGLMEARPQGAGMFMIRR